MDGKLSIEKDKNGFVFIVFTIKRQEDVNGLTFLLEYSNIETDTPFQFTRYHKFLRKKERLVVL